MKTKKVADKRKKFFKNIDALQDAIVQAQTEYVKKEYGKKAADTMNIGWGVACEKNAISFCSKVYSHPIVTLQTNADLWTDPKNFEMDCEPYER